MKSRNHAGPTGSHHHRLLVIATGLFLAATFVWLLAGSIPASASSITISQHDFVQLCKRSGGTPTRVDTHVVKCTIPGGPTSTCNFETHVCQDIFLPRTAATPTIGAPSGGITSQS